MEYIKCCVHFVVYVIVFEIERMSVCLVCFHIDPYAILFLLYPYDQKFLPNEIFFFIVKIDYVKNKSWRKNGVEKTRTLNIQKKRAEQ